LSDEAAIGEAASRTGLNPAAVLEATVHPDVKGALRDNTDEALARGVVGVPSVIVGGRVHWGDDRLEEAAGA
jgi:2-hydroxychromene-2-carboxylate isomerase